MNRNQTQWRKSGAEKDSERNGKALTAVVAVVSREFAFFLSPILRPLRALSKP
jgi:hypothetical protein